MNKRVVIGIWTHGPRWRARRIEAEEALGRRYGVGALSRRRNDDFDPDGAIRIEPFGQGSQVGGAQDRLWPWWDGVD